MNGKGRAPEKGYNRAAYRTNYDAIFRKQLKTMKTNQPGLEQPTILPWHREAAKEIMLHCNDDWYVPMDAAHVIARHDQHAETLRLLEEAYEVVKDYGYGACVLRDEIRAHLAALSKPAAMQQSAKQEGTQ